VSKSAVVFDLDGTLIDSLTDIIESFREACVAVGLSDPGDAAVRALVGRPLDEMLAPFDPSGDRIQDAVAAYRRIYPARFTQATTPFPGVLEVLEGLRHGGFVLAVATTKRSDMARRLTAALGLDAYLDHVQGTDGFSHKPAPDVIHAALSALAADGVWMVGDTASDLQAGRAAGLKTYGVTWGTHDRVRLAGEQPDALEDDLTPLLTLASQA
jgi:phosphoglycolate phosphatase